MTTVRHEPRAVEGFETPGEILGRLAATYNEAARPKPGVSWNVILPVAFVLGSGLWFVSFLAGPGSLGYDGRVYAFAAKTMLEGGNPWTADMGGGTFAGLPTGLLPFLPFAWLPQEWTAGIVMALDLVAWVLVLRRLNLRPYWLAFPPLFGSIIAANAEVLVVALIAFAPGRWAGLAPVLKPYAVLPLVAERRWGAIAFAAVVGLATFLVLPWGLFVASLPRISEAITIQSFGENAWGHPTLTLIAGVALLSMGRRGLWFATSAFWPHAQNHYGLMTLPVLTPVIALCWALPIPQAIVVGIAAGAIMDRAGNAPTWARAFRTSPRDAARRARCRCQ